MGSVQDIVGLALPLIGAYGDLDNLKQKVALIDPVSVGGGREGGGVRGCDI